MSLQFDVFVGCV